MSKLSYKECGVDRASGDHFVDRIKTLLCGMPVDPRVRQGIGGFAALYDMGDGRFLASGTDGVGTKLKLAQELGIHHTLGIDLVAMCVNDILCTGARPLFFLDYLAFGKLEGQLSSALMEGIVAGCKEGGLALVGGETAEMPGVYAQGEYDMAGFCVGEVYAKDLLEGKNINDGDLIIGLASSGFHSNGFGLLRKLFEHASLEEKRQLLTPTAIYTKAVFKLKELLGSDLKGLAHMTGSGLYNIPRISAQVDYLLTSWPKVQASGSLFEKALQLLGNNVRECFETFNMGIGMVAVVDASTGAKLKSSEWQVLGHVRGAGKGAVELQLDGENYTFIEED